MQLTLCTDLLCGIDVMSVWHSTHCRLPCTLPSNFSLATYSERIYYESVYPDLVAWWWEFRYFEFLKPGYVDTAIYDGGGQRPYWDKVYLTGARFLEDLRARVGDELFFGFLRDYYTQYLGKRATGTDFFRVLYEYTSADISDLLAKYFKNTY